MILTDLFNTIKKLWEKISFHKHFKQALPWFYCMHFLVIFSLVNHFECVKDDITTRSNLYVLKDEYLEKKTVKYMQHSSI